MISESSILLLSSSHRLTRQKEDDEEFASSCECEHDPEDVSPPPVLHNEGANDCCVRHCVSFRSQTE